MESDKIYLIVGIAVFSIVIFVITKRPRDDTHKIPMLKQIRDGFEALNPAYATIPLAEGNSAYTDNKTSITLCLRDPAKPSYEYDKNTMMYVSLHELAHMITRSHGHGPEFKSNFSALLKKAADKGVYDPKKAIPENYCGVKA